MAQGSDQLAVSAQDLAKNATDQAVAVDSLAQSVSEITEQILGTSKSIDIVHDKAKDVGTTAMGKPAEDDRTDRGNGAYFRDIQGNRTGYRRN